MLDTLRESVAKKLSEKRYNHTLGVELTAERLAKIFLPEKVNEIRAAALLHDISKEYSEAELVNLLKQSANIFESDYKTPAAYHAFCAPTVIQRDFPEYATSEILSAVFNHTTGSESMSLFDKIIFISDYIEPGRKYYQCIETGNRLFTSLKSCSTEKEQIFCLDSAVLSALSNTVAALYERGAHINIRTLRAKEALSEIML